MQITGLNRSLRRPKYVFGVDGLQALHLAMKCAVVDLESADADLEWLGQKDYLALPKFLPDLPKTLQQRLEAMVEREAARLWALVQGGSREKRSAKRKKSTRRRATK